MTDNFKNKENQVVDIDELTSQMSWRHDMIKDIELLNTNAKAKGPVRFRITLNKNDSESMFMTTINRQKAIGAFRDINTGLMIANTRKIGDNMQYTSIQKEFNKQVTAECQRRLDVKMDTLQQIYDNDKNAYEKVYRPLDEIRIQAQDAIFHEDNINSEIKRQVNLMPPSVIPEVNQYLVFDDTNITNQMSTYRLPYKDPAKRVPDSNEQQLVSKFLSAFVDEYNLRVLSWYLGAMLMNKPIYDDSVSKMLVVSSAGGGCGKNTLFEALFDALLTDKYCDIKPDMDAIFDKQNRFGGGDMLNLRATMYLEANWSITDPEAHDLSGFALSEWKSLLSDGYFSRERKFADVLNNRVSSLQVCLTNHFPAIESKRTDLTRRILPMILKSTRMEEKGRQLGLTSSKAIKDFVKEHAQAFADCFVHYYRNHKYEFTNVDYDATDAIKSVTDVDNETNKALAKRAAICRAILAKDPVKGIEYVGKVYGVNVTKLVNDINDAKDTKNEDIRFEDGVLYLNATKKFLAREQCIALRAHLAEFCDIVTKFHKRMFIIGKKLKPVNAPDDVAKNKVLDDNISPESVDVEKELNDITIAHENTLGYEEARKMTKANDMMQENDNMSTQNTMNNTQVKSDCKVDDSDDEELNSLTKYSANNSDVDDSIMAQSTDTQSTDTTSVSKSFIPDYDPNALENANLPKFDELVNNFVDDSPDKSSK